MKVNSQDMRQKILAAYKHNPDCANDDKLLIATIWYMEGWTDPELYHKLANVSSAETIRRTRQRLVQDGIIKPADEVLQKRAEEEEKVREALR